MLDEKSLARDESWQRSRFGELEAFMVEYLVGGASAGESLRLKLQTPLFVSDALLEAARQQLQAELSTAEQVWRDPGPVSAHCCVSQKLSRRCMLCRQVDGADMCCWCRMQQWSDLYRTSWRTSGSRWKLTGQRSVLSAGAWFPPQCGGLAGWWTRSFR